MFNKISFSGANMYSITNCLPLLVSKYIVHWGKNIVKPYEYQNILDPPQMSDIHIHNKNKSMQPFFFNITLIS